MSEPQAVLLDVEGTTTPVAFVYEVLFPFARERLAAFVRSAPAADIDGDLERLRSERAAEGGEGAPPEWRDEAPRESAVAYLDWLMERDRKSTGLKSVQGKIWEEGYRSGELKGAVYPDVAPALARWSGRGTRVAIFSSGSVLAQKLLFRHSTAGDLTPYLSGHFDTAAGPKREPGSYRRIAAALESDPGAVLFVSDVVAELDAAAAAGMRTALSLRDGAPAPPTSHPAIRSFDEL